MAVTKCAFLLRNAPAANTPVALSMLAGMPVGALAIHGSLALPDPWEPRCDQYPEHHAAQLAGETSCGFLEPSDKTRHAGAVRAPSHEHLSLARGSTRALWQAFPAFVQLDRPTVSAITAPRSPTWPFLPCGGVTRSLMLDLGVEFGAEQNHDG